MSITQIFCLQTTKDVYTAIKHNLSFLSKIFLLAAAAKMIRKICFTAGFFKAEVWQEIAETLSISSSSLHLKISSPNTICILTCLKCPLAYFSELQQNLPRIINAWKNAHAIMHNVKNLWLLLLLPPLGYYDVVCN